MPTKIQHFVSLSHVAHTFPSAQHRQFSLKRYVGLPQEMESEYFNIFAQCLNTTQRRMDAVHGMADRVIGEGPISTRVFRGGLCAHQLPSLWMWTFPFSVSVSIEQHLVNGRCEIKTKYFIIRKCLLLYNYLFRGR